MEIIEFIKNGLVRNHIKELVAGESLDIAAIDSWAALTQYLCQHDGPVILFVDEESDRCAELKKQFSQLYILYVAEKEFRDVIRDEPDMFFSVDGIVHLAMTELNMRLVRNLVKRKPGRCTPYIQLPLLPNADEFSFRIAHTADRDKVLMDMANTLAKYDIRTHQQDYFIDIADEILSNAIYDAPAKPDGEPKYYHQERTVHFALDADEIITGKYYIGKESIGISVFDNFGLLKKEHIYRVLHKCYTQDTGLVNTDKTGSAQVGFYKVLYKVCDLVINIDLGKRTEVICVLDRHATRRSLRIQPRSFFYNVLSD